MIISRKEVSMIRHLARSLAASLALAACLGYAGSAQAEDDCYYRTYGRPDLFYNGWVAPNCGGVGASLYLSPRPVPPYVGNTYITYQPLMPHEFLYHHHRGYHRYYNDGRGLNRTCVRYW
jgi:hypothetical protein